MAQRVVTSMIDDLDGGPAEETLNFAVDGVTYEIDLSTQNAAAVRARFADLASAGRRLTPITKTTSRGKGTGRKRNNEDATAVRDWARTNGWPNLGDRGRLSNEIRDAYQAANT